LVVPANKTGRVAALELLIRLGADVKTDDVEGDCPIITCAQYGDVQMLNMLLAAGASANTCSGDGGFSPLTIACMGGHDDMALALCKLSSKRTLRDKDGYEGQTAADCIIAPLARNWRNFSPLHLEVIAAVVLAGGPVEPQNATAVLPAVLARAKECPGERARMTALASRLEKLAAGGDEDDEGDEGDDDDGADE